MAIAVPLLCVRDTIICVFQSDLTDATAERYQAQLLERIERTGGSNVLLEVSALDLVDSYVAQMLLDTATMARLMGARAVLVGVRPEVAATLVHMGHTLAGIETALNVDHAFKLLAQRVAA